MSKLDLLDYVRLGDVKKVQTLVDSGVDLDLTYDNLTLLSYVVKCDIQKIVIKKILTILLDAGADVNATNSYGHSALISSFDCSFATRILLNAGVDVNMRSYGPRMTQLMWAVRCTLLSEEAETIMKMVLEADADVRAKDSCGWTAIHHLVRAGYVRDDFDRPNVKDTCIITMLIESIY